jgi:transposase
MKQVKRLSKESIITLQALYKYGPSHRLRQRAHILLLSDKGFSITELSYVTDLDRDTISLTLNSWEEKGLGGLYDKPGRGRKPIYTEQEQAMIAEKLEQEPRQIKKIRADIANQTGKSASVDTLKRIVKHHGMVWKRLQKEPAKQPDPLEYSLKKQKLESLKKSQK